MSPAHAKPNSDFAYQVLSVVEEIPEGCVATYGQIAQLIGRPKNSRLVARVLSHAEYYGEFPLPPRCEPCGPSGTGVGRAGVPSAPRRRGIEGRNPC